MVRYLLEVLKAVGTKMALFWVVAPYSLVEVINVSEVLAASIIRAMMMEAARSSETLGNSHQTTRRYNPEDSHLHQYPIRGHGRSCRACPLSCARSFTDSPRYFDSGDYKLRRACYTFLVLRVFEIRGDYQERNLPRTSSHNIIHSFRRNVAAWS
jgi:hypothetical protein